MKRSELRRMIRARYDNMQDFCDEIGISRTALYHILRGETDPSRTTLEAIRRVLQLPEEDLGRVIFPAQEGHDAEQTGI